MTEIPAPSRQAYEGFVWKEITGAGLKLWAQENGQIQLMADTALPGFVIKRKDLPGSQPVIQVFDLPHRNIDDALETLERSADWNPCETCRFKEIPSKRKGVRRFILLPDGRYAQKMDSLMLSEPLPSPCNGWGVGNSGQRFFEIHDNHPDKAIFMEIGQDAPLFDENSVVFVNDKNI